MQGEVRTDAAGVECLQPQIHGGHERGVRQVPGDGGAEAPLLQGNTLLHPQMPQRLPGS